MKVAARQKVSAQLEGFGVPGFKVLVLLHKEIPKTPRPWSSQHYPKAGALTLSNDLLVGSCHIRALHRVALGEMEKMLPTVLLSNFEGGFGIPVNADH